MTTPLPLRDRAALAWYLARVRVWLTGAPRGRARGVVADLRREASATAAETGMAAALADLGSPRALAGTYVEESGAPLGSRAVRVVALTTALVVGLAAFGVWRWYTVASTPRLTTLGYALDAGFSELATTGQQVALDATEPLTVGVPVKNDGPVTVTIDTEDVELVQVRFSTEDATADPPSFTFDPDNGELLERVVLGPGEEVMVYAIIDPGCLRAVGGLDGTVASVPSVTVRIRSLGITTDQVIRLPEGYGFANTSGTSGDLECG